MPHNTQGIDSGFLTSRQKNTMMTILKIRDPILREYVPGVDMVDIEESVKSKDNDKK